MTQNKIRSADLSADVESSYIPKSDIVNGGRLSEVFQSPKVTSITIPNTTLGRISATYPDSTIGAGVTTLSFPNLTAVTEDNADLTIFPELTTLTMPVLTTAKGINMGSGASLTTLDISALTTLDTSLDLGTNLACDLDISSLTAVTTEILLSSASSTFTAVTFAPSLACPRISITGATSLATITGLTALTNITELTITDSSLTEASVDMLLVAAVSSDDVGLTKQIALTGVGTAIPSATGLAAKATLEGRGWSVSVMS